jgi:pimeloyl-ACP methyl ester carboxylesterase
MDTTASGVRSLSIAASVAQPGRRYGVLPHTARRGKCAWGDSRPVRLRRRFCVRRNTVGLGPVWTRLALAVTATVAPLGISMRMAMRSPRFGECRALVMAPGFAGTRDTNALIDYARGFAAAGLDVVLFDYRGFGGSGGSRACMTVAGTPLKEPRSISCARRAATARSPRSRPQPTSCTR